MVVGSFEEWLVGIADVYIEIDCRSRVANVAKRGPKRGQKGDQKVAKTGPKKGGQNSIFGPQLPRKLWKIGDLGRGLLGTLEVNAFFEGFEFFYYHYYDYY